MAAIFENGGQIKKKIILYQKKALMKANGLCTIVPYALMFDFARGPESFIT